MSYSLPYNPPVIARALTRNETKKFIVAARCLSWKETAEKTGLEPEKRAREHYEALLVRLQFTYTVINDDDVPAGHDAPPDEPVEEYAEGQIKSLLRKHEAWCQTLKDELVVTKEVEKRKEELSDQNSGFEAELTRAEDLRDDDKGLRKVALQKLTERKRAREDDDIADGVKVKKQKVGLE